MRSSTYRRLFGAAALVSVAAVGACSSSSHSGASNDAGLPDANPDATITIDSGAAQDSGAPAPDATLDTGTITADSATTDTAPPADSGGSIDSGSIGDAAAVSCTGLKYCDDFETYEAGALVNKEMLGPWVVAIGGNTSLMAIDGVNPYQSAQSLHITVPVADAGANGTLTQSALDGGLIPGNDMFGRAMVYYSNKNGNGLPLGVHSWIFNSTGHSDQADGGVTMNLGGGGMKLQINYHPPAPLTEQSVQGGMITAGTWHCVQWEYNGSLVDGSVADDAKVWVDGTLAVEAPASKGWNFATPWTVFLFGFTHYQVLENPIDVYLDDFALSDAMVPCPP